MVKQLSLVDVLRDTLRKIEGSDDENKQLPIVIELTEQLLKSLDDLRARGKAVDTAATGDPCRSVEQGPKSPLIKM
jgi:hypothetical protein